MDGIINCAKSQADKKLKAVVGKQILDDHFIFEKSETVIEVYVEEYKLERLNLEEFKKSEYPATQLWLHYKILDENLTLTEFLFQFNLNCSTSWTSSDTKEIIEPYLKALDFKTKIDLKKALEIGEENGLNEIYDWDIDFEKRKLVWTIKSKQEKGKSKVIKINSKNGNILTEYIEIQID